MHGAVVQSDTQRRGKQRKGLLDLASWRSPETWMRVVSDRNGIGGERSEFRTLKGE